MTKQHDSDADETSRTDDARGDAVESAGETVAADTISGPQDERPVGADTLVQVEGDGERKD